MPYESINIIGMMRSGTNAIAYYVRNLSPNPTKIIDQNTKEPNYHPDPNFPKTAQPSIYRARFKIQDDPKTKLQNPPPHAVLLLVLRDPYNHFASQLETWKYGRAYPEEKRASMIKYYPILWKKIAQIFIENQTPNIIPVNFNDWNNKTDYRLSLTQKLQYPDNTTAEQLKTTKCAFSPFNGQYATSWGDTPNFNTRWKFYVDKPYYTNLFKDKQLTSLATKIFGPPPFSNSWHGVKIHHNQKSAEN